MGAAASSITSSILCDITLIGTPRTTCASTIESVIESGSCDCAPSGWVRALAPGIIGGDGGGDGGRRTLRK